jgi:hypothetical protein
MVGRVRGNRSPVGSRCARGNGEHGSASAGSQWTNCGTWVTFCYPAGLPYRVQRSGSGCPAWAGASELGCEGGLFAGTGRDEKWAEIKAAGMH